ncbi:hypothetical protein SRHO_G00062070 [Serrasalmus rhombeus]
MRSYEPRTPGSVSPAGQKGVLAASEAHRAIQREARISSTAPPSGCFVLHGRTDESIFLFLTHHSAAELLLHQVLQSAVKITGLC